LDGSQGNIRSLCAACQDVIHPTFGVINQLQVKAFALQALIDLGERHHGAG
jgi:hypothetical protein